MQELEEWKRSFQKHFKGSSQSKCSRFYVDVSCALFGIKPVHLVDYLPQAQDPHKLQLFLQEALSESRDHHEQDLCILTLEEDVLFVNCAAALSNKTLPVFVDVTKGLERPRVMQTQQDFTQTHKLLSGMLKNDSPFRGDATIPIVCGDSGSVLDGNVCSLFGVLLGYPVVYWFDTSKGYNLDMEKLVCHSVLAKMEGVKAVGHTLFSFTVPECVLPSVQGVIDAWYDTVRACATDKQVELEMRKETALLPTIAL